MAVTPVTNINTEPHKPYLEAEGAIKTTKNTKPLPPEGHLVHDSVATLPKFFVKDIVYDLKAVKDGFQGNTNDHQQGRLNDVGLTLGGLGIATVLAARTRNPMLRIMEFTGLGAFLASMSIFPTIAINVPSRIIHGFDSGKEYIDDQGRKKSVFQDPNYIPWDMYLGDYPGEDLNIVGDRMGIPREIKNRNDLIKEQARKIATQNNTLWMLTAGFATPIMAALACFGLERVIAPPLEKARNTIYNSKISGLLKKTGEMSEQVNNISPNSMSRDVEKILENYKGGELPKAEYDSLVKILTKDIDENTSEGIKEDLTKIFENSKNGVKSYVLPDNYAEKTVMDLKANLPSRNRAVLERVFVPQVSEVKEIVDRYGKSDLTGEQLENFKGEFRKLFEKKIEAETAMPKEALRAYENRILENISKKIKKAPLNYVSEENMKAVVDFAKVMGEFKKNRAELDKCKTFKVEYAPETVIARSYGKFESTLLDVLDIKHKELKQIRESDKFAQEIFDKKLSELVKDDVKYKNAVEKLAKVMREMEINLNGRTETGSHMKDLITGIENNYNNTAKRLNTIGKFSSTIDKLVKEDVSTLSNSLESRQDLFDFLDGMRKDKYAGVNYWDESFGKAEKLDYAKYNSRGAGSSKNQEISRIAERYQGAKNSMNRIIHLFEFYKRPQPAGEYDKSIISAGKDALMGATSSDHTMKLNTINNPEYYKDIVRMVWRSDIEEVTENGLKVSDGLSGGDVLGRYKKYIQRFKDIISNNDIDFTKPHHILDGNTAKQYAKSEKTRMSKFNLVAKNSIDFIKDAAGRRYGNQKWLRIVSATGGVVLGATVGAQFGFGKIKNPHNIQRQVNDDSNI